MKSPPDDVNKGMKICVLFSMQNCDKIFDKINSTLSRKFPNIIKLESVSDRRMTGKLPYHMTIIQGAVSQSKLQDILSRIKQDFLPFSKAIVPKVNKIEATFFGQDLILWLKFKNNSYKITGDIKLNKLWSKRLESNMAFDIPRHITICNTPITIDNPYQNIDLILPFFQKTAQKYLDQLTESILLTPEIWIKPDGGKWQRYDG